MSVFKSSIVALALGFSVLSSFNAQAANLSLSADLNPLAGAEQYQFASPFITTSTFMDIVNLGITPFRDLVASISGVGNQSIAFTSFDLYSGDSDGVNTLVKAGEVFNSTNTPGLLAKVTFGNLEQGSLAGNYFLKIAGNNIGSSPYSGDISLTSPVPEANTLAMMLAGLGLMGFVARRRKA